MKLFLMETFLILFAISINPFDGLAVNVPEGAGDRKSVTPVNEPYEAIKDRVFLVMKSEKRQAYLHEAIPLSIKLFVSELSLKEVGPPSFRHGGFSINEFDNPLQKQETINGILFDTVEFRTTIFGTETGNLRLGPAELQCILLNREERGEKKAVDNYFGSFEAYSLKLTSQEISLKVLPLPKKGRPADFSGAVGSFDLLIEVHPKKVRVGDPVTLRMVIKGKGNFDTVTSPKMEETIGLKVHEPQVRQKNRIRIYEQVVLPQTDNVKAIPKVRFSFYDPDREIYRILVRGPIPLEVTKPEGKEGSKAFESLSADMTQSNASDVREFLGRFMKVRALLLLQIILLLLLISVWLLRKRRERLKNDLRYAMQRRASKRAKHGIKEAKRILRGGESRPFYDCMFKTLQGYLGDKFGIPSRGVTVGIVDEILKPKGVKEDWCKKLRDIFQECDRTRYGSFRWSKTEMEKTLETVQEIINHLERQRP